jgi:Cu(I)/Ag(I) efflux system membrane fusion protein
MKTRIRTILSYALTAVLGAGAYAYREPLLGWMTSPDAEAEMDHSAHAAPVAQPGERKVLYWVDPMHPAYKADKPGIAPDCGMQLEPVYADDAAQLAGMPPGTVRLSTERQQLIGVRTGTAEMQPVRRVIRATARLAYDETRITHVHTKVEGWIEQVFVDYTGAPVRAGQPLFTIYSPELVSAQQEYLIALRAKKQMADSPLPELSRSSESLYQASRQRLKLWDVTEEQIQRLEETGQPRRTLTFYAPHGGIVLEKKAFEHQRITQDSDLYTVADLSRIWALAEVYEYEAPFVRLGQPAMLTLSYVPGQVFHGRVTFIAPQLDPQTRTLQVRLEFSNPGLKLRPEMFGTAEINVDMGKQLVVPADSVVDTGLKQMVFIARGDGYFEPREVLLGPRIDGFYAVMNGVAAGETVVTSANFLIDSESRLKAAVSQMGGTKQAEPPHKH